MSIKKIDKVYCSLNLGYVYNLNYSFTPREGCKITLFFINESGNYKKNILSSSKKAQIKIGGAIFNMFPVRSKELQNGTEKTFSVDFIDDTFRLRNYYVALTNRGCGKNVFQLGKTVDKRTDAEKEKEDPDLFKIKEFTTFEDVEYSFSDFVDVLKQVFPIKLLVTVDNAITRPFEGTFAEVLDAWCAYFNYSYFFENGELLIFDPVSMNIKFPEIPENAISFSQEESIENMYDKTVWNAFLSDGREIQLEGFSNDNIYLQGLDLIPWEDVFGLRILNSKKTGEDILDINQVIAAQHGIELWFLYNYYKGTEASECGFVSLSSENKTIIVLNQYLRQAISGFVQTSFFYEEFFQKQHKKYFEYGKSIAGRYYLTRDKYPQATQAWLSRYSWRDCSQASPATKEGLEKMPQISLDLFDNPPRLSSGFLQGTKIEGTDFEGIQVDGPRLFFYDNSVRNEEVFALSDELRKKITATYKKITEGIGNVVLRFSDGEKNVIIHEKTELDNEIIGIFNTFPSKRSAFDYRIKTGSQTRIFVRGYYNQNIIDETDPNLPFNDDQVTIIENDPLVSANSSIMRAIKNFSYVAYLKKYSSCVSESSDAGAINRRFEGISPSIDLSTPIDLTRDSKGVVTINRNLDFVKLYQNSEIIKKLANPFLIPEKKIEFTINYFDQNIPTSFISNGLVAMNVVVSENGLTATYTYSNEMLKIPESQQFIEKLEKSIKNSYIRNYVPVKTWSV